MQRVGTIATIAALAIASGLPAAAAAQNVSAGSYECWFFSRARLDLNFRIVDGKTFTDSEGKQGTYSVADGVITFQGGALDGEKAHYLIEKGRPKASFRNGQGREISFCEKV